MTVEARDTSARPNVPVIERVRGGALTDHLRSEAVQRLMEGLVDLVEVKRVSGYIGQASTRTGLRLIRISVHPPLDAEAITFVLCHELAHHAAGVRRGHCDAWREACADLVREAGRLGLLPRHRVEQGVAMVLDGTATKFRGWPEEERAFHDRRAQAREATLEDLRERGLRVGGQVVFRYHGKLLRAEVMRVNTATVSVGEIGSGRTSLRVPLSRILDVREP